MVTEAFHKMTKTGKPFGGMTLEDYHGAHKVQLWRDDYLKFKDFCVEGWFLFVKGKVQMRQFRGAEELEFKSSALSCCPMCSRSWPDVAPATRRGPPRRGAGGIHL